MRKLILVLMVVLLSLSQHQLAYAETCGENSAEACTSVSSSGSTVTGVITVPGSTTTVAVPVAPNPGPPVVEATPVPVETEAAWTTGETVAEVAWGRQPAPAPAPPATVTLEQAARREVTSLQLPTVPLSIGPDPAANEWGMAVVGYPLWLWVPPASGQTTTATVEGASLAITATPGPLTVDMGDGARVTCTTSTPLAPSVAAGTPSPDCGHAYLVPGTYTVQASTTWTIGWSSNGTSGTFPLTTTSQRTIVVGELLSALR